MTVNHTPYNHKKLERQAITRRRMEMRYKSVSDLDQIINESRNTGQVNQQSKLLIANQSKIIKNNASLDLSISFNSIDRSQVGMVSPRI